MLLSTAPGEIIAVLGDPVAPAVPCRVAGPVDAARGIPDAERLVRAAVARLPTAIPAGATACRLSRCEPWLKTAPTPISANRASVDAAHCRKSAPRTGPGRIEMAAPAS